MLRLIACLLLLLACVGCSLAPSGQKIQQARTADFSATISRPLPPLPATPPVAPAVPAAATKPIAAESPASLFRPDDQTRPPLLPAEDINPTAIVNFTADGVSASVPPGTNVQIRSNTQESQTTEPPKKSPLTTQIYLAVGIVMIVGFFVCLKAGWIYGLPLVVVPLLFLAAVQTFDLYPKETAWSVAGFVALCAAAIGWHFYNHRQTASALQTTQSQLQSTQAEAETLRQTTSSQADALSNIKRAVEKTPDAAKAEVKAAIKSVVGDSTNPVRQQFDQVIQSV